MKLRDDDIIEEGGGSQKWDHKSTDRISKYLTLIIQNYSKRGRATGTAQQPRQQPPQPPRAPAVNPLFVRAPPGPPFKTGTDLDVYLQRF